MSRKADLFRNLVIQSRPQGQFRQFWLGWFGSGHRFLWFLYFQDPVRKNGNGGDTDGVRKS